MFPIRESLHRCSQNRGQAEKSILEMTLDERPLLPATLVKEPLLLIQGLCPHTTCWAQEVVLGCSYYIVQNLPQRPPRIPSASAETATLLE